MISKSVIKLKIATNRLEINKKLIVWLNENFEYSLLSRMNEKQVDLIMRKSIDYLIYINISEIKEYIGNIDLYKIALDEKRLDFYRKLLFSTNFKIEENKNRKTSLVVFLDNYGRCNKSIVDRNIECSICYDESDIFDWLLPTCGHWIHLSCQLRWGDDCVICRKYINICRGKKIISEYH